MILGNFFSKELSSGSFANFQGILVRIQTMKINFYVTKCEVEMEIYEHVCQDSRAGVANWRL